MHIIVDKKTCEIIESLSAAEIVDNKWVRSKGGSLIQLDMVDVVEVDSLHTGSTYYYDSKPQAKSRAEKEAQENELKQRLSALDNPRDAESLFDALKAKGVLVDADLPAQTLERFNQKKQLRQQLSS